jgi:hypothetical protein
MFDPLRNSVGVTVLLLLMIRTQSPITGVGGSVMFADAVRIYVLYWVT